MALLSGLAISDKRAIEGSTALIFFGGTTMNMKSIFLSTALIGATICGSLTAGNDWTDCEENTNWQPTMDCVDFSGWNTGIQIGYGWDVSDSYCCDTGDGFLGGFHLGYNFSYCAAVLGITADWNATSIGSGSCCEPEMDMLASIRAKIGWSCGCFLPYATGGVGFVRIDPNIPFSDDKNWETGYVLGGGVSWWTPFSDCLRSSIDLEALYYHFDDTKKILVEDTEIVTVSLGLTIYFP